MENYKNTPVEPNPEKKPEPTKQEEPPKKVEVVKTQEKPEEPVKPEEPKKPLPPPEPEEDGEEGDNSTQTPNPDENEDEVNVDTTKPENGEGEEDIQITDDKGNVMKESDDDDDDEYLHGRCHEWAFDNYQDGDRFFVITEYDYEIESPALLHCGLYRDGKYIDSQTQTTDIDDILDNFDYGDEMEIEILTLEEFKDFCQDFGLI